MWGTKRSDKCDGLRKSNDLCFSGLQQSQERRWTNHRVQKGDWTLTGQNSDVQQVNIYTLNGKLSRVCVCVSLCCHAVQSQWRAALLWLWSRHQAPRMWESETSATVTLVTQEWRCCLQHLWIHAVDRTLSGMTRQWELKHCCFVTLTHWGQPVLTLRLIT